MLPVRTFLPVIYAFLLLLPTFYGIRAEFFILFMGVVFAGERAALASILTDFRKEPFCRASFPIWLVAGITVLSLFNKIINGHDILCASDYYASFYLLPGLFLCSKLLKNPLFYKTLILITAVEVLLGVVQYFMGIRTFFSGLGSQYITNYSLLYDSRVYGLSSNSSMLAYKAFLALLLIDVAPIRKSFLEWLLRVVLVIGILLSFSRSVVLVMIVYFFIQVIYLLIKYRKEAWGVSVFQSAALCLGLTLIFLSPLKMQLTRNEMQAEKTSGLELKEEDHPKNCAESHALPMSKGETDPEKMKLGDKLLVNNGMQTSGRKQIWLNYINFIEDHFWVGNGSDKLMLLSWHPVLQKYKLVHAHNSFIQLLATNGIVLFMMYMVLFVSLFRKTNLIPLIAIVLYSVANYGVFWGFSYMDLVFFIFLSALIVPFYDHTRAHH
jgi:hypothetical protein